MLFGSWILYPLLWRSAEIGLFFFLDRTVFLFRAAFNFLVALRQQVLPGIIFGSGFFQGSDLFSRFIFTKTGTRMIFLSHRLAGFLTNFTRVRYTYIAWYKRLFRKTGLLKSGYMKGSTSFMRHFIRGKRRFFPSFCFIFIRSVASLFNKRVFKCGSTFGCIC